VSCFWWYRDQIVCSGADEAQIGKLLSIAVALSASVVGDDGEKYELRKTFFGEEKIVTVWLDGPLVLSSHSKPGS
jgi:hypothetical protein